MSKWSIIELSKITDLITDGSHYSPKTTQDGYPYVTVRDVDELGSIDLINSKKISEADFKDLENSNCRPEKGDILFSKDGTVGKVSLIDFTEPFVVLSSLAIIRPNKEVIDPNFLKYMFLSPNIQEEAIGLKTGAAIKRVVLRTLKKLKFPVPSLDEQKRIVAKLDILLGRIDKTIALLEENIQSVNELMGSVLDKEFTTIDDSKRYQLLEHAELNRESIKPEEGKTYNYIGLENIESGSGKLVDYSPTEGENISSTKVKFEKGNVLYSKLRPYLNKVIIADFDGVATTEILPIKTDTESLLPEYLAFYFRSPSFLAEVNRNTSGARMPRATTKFFKKEVLIPVPAKEKQKKSIKKLKHAMNDLYQLNQHYMIKLDYLKSLKNSLLDQAFKGELVN